jgi:hypothetical protein
MDAQVWSSVEGGSVVLGIIDIKADIDHILVYRRFRHCFGWYKFYRLELLIGDASPRLRGSVCIFVYKIYKWWCL